MDNNAATEPWRRSAEKRGASTGPEAESFMVLMGVIMVMLGILALSSLIVTTFASVVALGAILAVGGIMQIVLALRRRNRKGFVFSLMSGILYLVLGAITVINPAVSLFGLTLLLSTFFIASGLYRVIAAAADKYARHRGWMAIRGVLALILGAILYIGWPMTSFWFIGLFIALELISTGISWIALAYVVKKVKAPLGSEIRAPLGVCYTATGKECPCSC